MAAKPGHTTARVDITHHMLFADDDHHVVYPAGYEFNSSGVTESGSFWTMDEGNNHYYVQKDWITVGPSYLIANRDVSESMLFWHYEEGDGDRIRIPQGSIVKFLMNLPEDQDTQPPGLDISIHLESGQLWQVNKEWFMRIYTEGQTVTFETDVTNAMLKVGGGKDDNTVRIPKGTKAKVMIYSDPRGDFFHIKVVIEDTTKMWWVNHTWLDQEAFEESKGIHLNQVPALLLSNWLAATYSIERDLRSGSSEEVENERIRGLIIEEFMRRER